MNIESTCQPTCISHNTASTATDVLSVDMKSMVLKSTKTFYKHLIAMCQYLYAIYGYNANDENIFS